MERRHMGYSHSLALPSKIIAEVEMHQPPERSRNGRKSGDDWRFTQLVPQPFIKEVGIFAGNQLAGREFN
jgi:hypothetical protein